MNTLAKPEPRISRRPLSRALLASAALLFAAGCAPENSTQAEVNEAAAAVRARQSEILAGRGVSGLHDLSLLQPESETISQSHTEGSVEGDLDGLYFLVVGGVDGDISGTVTQDAQTAEHENVKFAWKSTSGTPFTTITEIPVNKIQVVEHAELLTPQIEFNVNSDALIYFGDTGNGACYYTNHRDQSAYQPERCMRTTDYANLNEFLAHPGFLHTVVLHLEVDDAADYYQQVGGL